MWFKKSSLKLSAAAILALATRDYMAAGIFFTLGVFKRMDENEEEKRREQEEERRVATSEDLYYSEQRLLRRLGEHDCDISNLQRDIYSLRENLKKL